MISGPNETIGSEEPIVIVVTAWDPSRLDGNIKRQWCHSALLLAKAASGRAVVMMALYMQAKSGGRGAGPWA